MSRPLLLGAVAYDPKVVTIWDGFRAWFRARGLDLDYVLYSHYERQVEDLLAGRIDLAWNSPLAWIRAERLARARGLPLRTVAMRDTDRDLTSVIVVRADSDLHSPGDLRGRTVATGAVDSPQATLLPLALLRGLGVDPEADGTLLRFDVGVGLHGDHIGGERDAATALLAGRADAACLIDANLLLFGRDGTLPSASVRVLAQTEPYDHCNMSVAPQADPALVDQFGELLLSMSYADDSARPLLDLEGLKEWLPGRTDRYAALDQAVSDTGFYDPDGALGADDYRP
ncbi:phosphate/phosphite/phosphonate ABC transporter substrate-binding protein [Plantactinospora soyae]|uniref:ABC-type phosphate/phosphonate transport system substrate-binding protein n=1 Tax=Plantactinospora soyae TaxID=1544732 RepID=A0A927QYL0_9ACTN|nr:PhnD/SsuA/transferrin family substrate-binding protein [Plantactinospora soyae]MBE1489345.1 ABC-type phosphate/phosphonate transport system substrate-binding protein [Plantactinospora soyae]